MQNFGKKEIQIVYGRKLTTSLSTITCKAFNVAIETGKTQNTPKAICYVQIQINKLLIAT